MANVNAISTSSSLLIRFRIITEMYPQTKPKAGPPQIRQLKKKKNVKKVTQLFTDTKLNNINNY